MITRLASGLVSLVLCAVLGTAALIPPANAASPFDAVARVDNAVITRYELDQRARLLTVLGNIVAVTSIIAVVSLVQGLNASVQDSIQSRFAADAFSVTRTAEIFVTSRGVTYN